MKFIFAPDSFKGSLSAMECCDILERVTARIFPGTETVSVPVADGGEGTVDALLRAMGGERIYSRVTGPMFEEETAVWGRTSDGSAVMEMAQASGLPYVPADQRDPRRATSLGTGEMIAEALRSGVRSILIGIGGSATNDGGMGMLKALGAKFTDENGEEVEPVGAGLARVMHADFSGLMPELKETQITVICDVGAAGGLGAALGGVLGAQLKSGIDAVLDAVHFDQKLEGVSLAFTGEGRIDGQSVRFGKVPVGVARRCAEKGIPAAAIVGGIGEGAEGLFDLCESTIMTTVSGPMSLEKAMADAPALYEYAAERLMRAIRIGMNLK